MSVELGEGMPVSNSITTSEAFQREALRSERIRIVGILSVLGALLLLVLGRTLLLGSAEAVRLLPKAIGLLGLMAAYEAGMLLVVRRSAASDRPVPLWCRPATVRCCFTGPIPTTWRASRPTACPSG